jgi:phenol 2-monooxygenase
MLGDSTDTVWGVMDIYPYTTFPDIRRKCTIHSSAGNLLIIPREGGSLVRFYIQLPAGSSPKDVKLEDLQNQAKAIFAPYTMDFKETFWWSAYSIGQRLADHFHKDMRVFLTGDACHTHSPKAGQGMNVSLQDGYNLGWKLGSVLSHLSPPEILHSYVQERSKTAADLIAFDKELSKLFSRKEQWEGEFAEYFTKSGRYMAGFTARYEDSRVTGSEGSEERVATGVRVGMRFPSAQVVRFCDARPCQLQPVCKSDGRWRVVVFAGDITRSPCRERLDEVSFYICYARICTDTLAGREESRANDPPLYSDTRTSRCGHRAHSRPCHQICRDRASYGAGGVQSRDGEVGYQGFAQDVHRR